MVQKNLQAPALECVCVIPSKTNSRTSMIQMNLTSIFSFSLFCTIQSLIASILCEALHCISKSAQVWEVQPVIIIVLKRPHPKLTDDLSHQFHSKVKLQGGSSETCGTPQSSSLKFNHSSSNITVQNYLFRKELNYCKGMAFSQTPHCILIGSC